MSAISATIAVAVQQQGAATQEIAFNVQQTAAGTRDVVANIAGVSQATQESGAAALALRGGTGALVTRADGLARDVDAFLEETLAA